MSPHPSAPARGLRAAALTLAALGALAGAAGSLVGAGRRVIAAVPGRPTGRSTSLTADLAAGDPAAIVVQVAVVTLAVAVAWLSVLVLGVSIPALRGVARPHPRSGIRAAAALWCGVATVGLAVPATGAPTGPSGVAGADAVAGTALRGVPVTARVLDGLPLPDLPTAPPREPRRGREDSRSDRAYVVRPGDSLWSITAARLPGASDAEVDAAWRALYAAHRGLIGPDPDHLAVGLRLRPTLPRKAPP